jgi:hypothetical protein
MRTGANGLAMLRALAVTAAVAIGFAPSSAAPQDDTERKLYDTAFAESRPKPKSPAKSPARKTARYRRATPAIVAAKPGKPALATTKAGGDAAIIGVTVWRLRPSAAADDATARILVHGPAQKNEEWTPERIEADTPLVEGQRVRLSIESPAEGYLYVIDREQYANGSYGEPYLIFPTSRLRAGDNAVRAGAVVEIPSQVDDPVFFELRRSRPDHVAEVITVLVSPTPLDVEIGAEAAVLDRTKLANWESKWSKRAERLELADGAGVAYTAAEKAAGANPSQQLTQDDPLPQTIYRVDSQPGAPVLVTIPLRIAR